MSKLWLVLKWTIIFVVSLYGLIYLIRLGYQEAWTGFGSYSTKEGFQREKTLWDWIDLIIAPLALSLLVAYINYMNKQNEERSKYEIGNIQKSLEFERLKIEQNIKIQQEQEQEKIVESLLQNYFEQIKELLLDHDLQNAEPYGRIANIARSLTMAIVRSLDPIRKTRMIQFLYDTNLIVQDNTVISLEKMDFGRIVLQGKYDRINLRGADLQNSIFEGCSLKNSSFEGALLIGSDLSNAKLFGASLKEADLGFTNLVDSDLAEIQLDKASTLRGAFMPSGDLYDGKYQLKGDIEYALSQGVDLSDAEVAHIWYSQVHTSISRAELEKLKNDIKKSY